MKLSALIPLGALGFLLPTLGVAQSVGGVGYNTDALQYSQNELIGSARMQGMGGAKVALGGDLSLAAVNPAGLGFFNRSSISITPGVYSQSAQANYLDGQVRDFATPAAIANFGVVFNSERDGPLGDWRGGNFAISWTRLNTYRDNITYEGMMDGSEGFNDFIGYAVNDLNNFGIDGATDLAYSAFDAFLVEQFVDENDNLFFDSYIFPPEEDFPTFQTEIINITGRKNVFNLSYGANYKDKLYIGGGIGFVSVRRTVDRTFEEVPFAAADSRLTNLIIEDEITQEGNGFNATVGVIYRPIPIVMLGASVETPTFLSIDETYSQFVIANYTNNFPVEEAAGQTIESGVATQNGIPFEFSMRTPFRARGGATVFVGKLGLVTADVEYVDYGSAILSSGESSMTSENGLIEDRYSSAINYSIGAEFRMDTFYARAGYAHRADAVRLSQEGTDNGLSYISAGVGVRKKRFFADVAYVNGQTMSDWARYDNSPVAQVRHTESRFVGTLGFNF